MTHFVNIGKSLIVPSEGRGGHGLALTQNLQTPPCQGQGMESIEKGAKLRPAANRLSSSASQKKKSALKADPGRMSRSALPFPGALTSSCSGRGDRLRGRKATTHSPHSGTEIQTSQTHPNLLVTHLGETTTSQSKQPVQTLSLHLSC